MGGDVMQEAAERMKKAEEALARELAGIRTGKANPALLDPIKVEYYGAPTPLRQLANIAAPEPRLLVIQPFDKRAIPEIEKAILKSPLGLNPASDGNLIRIPIPSLTEERRRELTKLVRKMGENAKVAVRNIRRDANDRLKKMEKDGAVTEDEGKKQLEKVQDLTNKNIDEIDKMIERKEKEVMEV
ncbi:MAG: ribosome recycling factor [Candidatus Eisenbacteria bacterium]|nr:ribosome recycling factor [Candidatus Eisenbacteria bacterium]